MAGSHATAVKYLKDYQVPSYLITHVDLTFFLNAQETIVKSILTVKKNPQSTDDSHELRLDGEDLTLKEIAINNIKLTPDQYRIEEGQLVIPGIADVCQVSITNTNNPKNNTNFEGLFISKNKFCTHCEPEGFRRITYYIDRPDNLATFTTTIYGDPHHNPQLLSNGNLVAVGKTADGLHYVKWEDPFPKPSYLFALVAGEFDCVQDHYFTKSNRHVKLQIFVEKGRKAEAHHAMYSLKKAMQWDEQTYGREYDLNVYNIVAVDDFNMGAMENKGLNIFNSCYILASPDKATDDNYVDISSVVAHEYLHNWTGNRITVRDWFQLFLKEGLTIFRDQSFSQDLFSKGISRIYDVSYLHKYQFNEDSGPLAHAVQPDSYIEMNNFYTATVYNKGAEIFRMVETILGKSTFRAAMNRYFDNFDGKAITIEDLIKTMEETSKKNLQQFRLWYSQAGTPTLTCESIYDETAQTYTLKIRQTCPATPNQPNKKPMYIPIRLALFDQQGKMIGKECVFSITHKKTRVQFNHISSRPIPSLLREFSAPVKLDYAYTIDELKVLFLHDTDPVNRWEAGQRIAADTILKIIDDLKMGRTPQSPTQLIAIYKELCKDHSIDEYFLATLLTLPSQTFIASKMEIIDVDNIHAALEFVAKEMVGRLGALFNFYYYYNKESTYANEFNAQMIGQRALKNRCLYYLMHSEYYQHYGHEQFAEALGKNMTDTQTALHLITFHQCGNYEAALQEFYERWQSDPLIVNKWFGMHAIRNSPDVIPRLKALMQHAAFDLKNPNSVRALISTFTASNWIQFHRKTGEGYEFLREVIEQLDAINPSLAADLVVPLTDWNRHTAERRELMKEQLQILLAKPGLSKDVYEIVSKGLLDNKLEDKANVSITQVTKLWQEPIVQVAVVDVVAEKTSELSLSSAL